MRLFIAIIVTLVTMLACKVGTSPTLSSDPSVRYDFMSNDDASTYLREGDIDGYYDYMSPAHMSVQTGDTASYPSLDAQMESYLDIVTGQTLAWTDEEILKMTSLMDSARALVEVINPALWPETIKMIKVDPAHYGDNVYYTLGQAIVWPANILTDFSISSQLPVALHEVWHLVSRYQPALRDSMFGLIGFYRHGYEVELGPVLSKQLLVNPDGVTMDYAIRLIDSTTGRSTEAIPLVASRFDRYDLSMPSFFDYLHFDLHELQVTGKQATVTAHPDATSKMDPAYFDDFFGQIKDNTQYIIHPDEIMADNFMMAIRAVDQDDMTPFSSEGRDLLQAVLGHLRDFEP